MPRRRKLLLFLCLFAAAAIAAYVALLRETEPPKTCDFVFDLGKARALSESLEGERAKEIRDERLTTFLFPGAAVSAGASWSTVEMPVMAYQLVFSDHALILDAGMSEPHAKAIDGTAYDAAAWQRVARGLQSARAVYVTHEHSDHMGGLFAGGPELYAHARLTPEQLAAKERLEPAAISDEALKTLKPFVYDGMLPVAPGVVLIKAPGHTPGSQWMYVRLQDGRELLFVGDTAWQMMAIDRVQGPPRMASLVLKNDRDANACQLVALRQLKQREGLRIIPGHDGEVIHALERSGDLRAGFL